nr:immunoglobulin heavy chain junction region [Macaca mulatta]
CVRGNIVASGIDYW